MEAIDDYANENIVRSLAYTALEERQCHHYVGLLPIASPLLRQRIQILEPTTPSAWDNAVQWQADDCPLMIESLWSSGGSVADEIYQKPVYYQRIDADTLHAVVEFATREKYHYIVILSLEEGSGEMSDLKYYNTKRLTEEEWIDLFENWSRTIEDAERVFLTRVTRHKRVFTAGTPDGMKEAPEDYWGDWSSDDGTSSSTREQQKEAHTGPHPLRDDLLKESEGDSDEEYYSRWSKDPGTLTPGQQEEQDEMAEEYDQSYNPLFTVPSVPNLMDAHTAALTELTTMLQNSLPGPHQQHQATKRVTQTNALPKAVSRLRTHPEEKRLIPGAYPESGAQSPVRTQQPKLSLEENKEAGRGLFMKSLSALIGAARLLGYEGKDILDMVQEIVNHPSN